MEQHYPNFDQKAVMSYEPVYLNQDHLEISWVIGNGYSVFLDKDPPVSMHALLSCYNVILGLGTRD